MSENTLYEYIRLADLHEGMTLNDTPYHLFGIVLNTTWYDGDVHVEYTGGDFVLEDRCRVVISCTIGDTCPVSASPIFDLDA